MKNCYSLGQMSIFREQFVFRSLFLPSFCSFFLGIFSPILFFVILLLIIIINVIVFYRDLNVRGHNQKEILEQVFLCVLRSFFFPF